MKNKAQKALEKVALQNNVTIDEVRKEIAFAIEDARKNPDPKIQAYWKSVPCKGEFPTPEEAILYISKQINKGKTFM